MDKRRRRDFTASSGVALIRRQIQKTAATDQHIQRSFLDEADFIFQAGNLKRTRRSGWLTIGIMDCESVADHSYRTALIAYLIAREEIGEAKAKDAMLLALLHDVHESRIGDLHKLAKKYANMDEKKAIEESIGPFAKPVKDADPKLAEIVKDADLLEMFFQAKEYADEGNDYAKEWLAPEKLKTKTAKSIYKKMVKRDSRQWIFGAVKW